MINATDQWLFTNEELLEIDTDFAKYLASKIEEFRSSLSLSQKVISTAKIFAWRWVVREGMVDLPLSLIAALIFLALKVEETPKKLDSIIRIFNCDSQTSSISKDDVLDYELLLLHVLCFDLSVKHPEKIIELLFKQNMENAVEDGHESGEINTSDAEKDKISSEDGVKDVYSCLNDDLKTVCVEFAQNSYSTYACLKFQTEIIVSACIKRAAATTDITIPENLIKYIKHHDAREIEDCIKLLENKDQI